MSTGEGEARAPTKAAILNYVENFIEKRDNQRRASGDAVMDARSDRGLDKDSIVIKTETGNFRGNDLNERISGMTDIDADELNLESDPMIETEEGGERIYRQQVYLRQYQPPTPDPIDIQVQEVMIKPKAQRPPIHVHVGPNRNRDEQRTPSPILIKSAPPQPSAPSSNEPLIYNKYIPADQKQTPQQIIIHRYPQMPPKPRPIVVEQWLPNKPAPKRITYRHVNRDEFARKDTEQLRNRFIEYSKPHTTIEVEIVRLPVIRLDPQEYQNRSTELTRLDQVRSTTQDPETLQWRI